MRALLSWVALRMPAGGLIAVACILVVEACRVGLVASAQEVEEYHFGAEAMIQHGGWIYRSTTAYVLSALTAAVGLAALAVVVLIASRRPSRWFFWTLPPMVIATGVSAAMMWVAWQHNPQGEIHNELGIDWVYWLGIGLSWFVPTYAVALVVAWSIAAASVILRRPA